MEEGDLTRTELAKGGEGTIVQTVDTVAIGLSSPNPFTELGFATLVLVLIILVHGWCLSRVSRLFSTRFALYTPRTPRWRVNAVMSTTIAVLAIIHLFETFIWTVPIWRFGMIPKLRDAYYYVLEAYTTLGEGNVLLPDRWRLVGPVIAISGLFTFGWTGSVLVYVMSEIGKLHSESSRESARTEANRRVGNDTHLPDSKT
jgi:hypothetical protein